MSGQAGVFLVLVLLVLVVAVLLVAVLWSPSSVSICVCVMITFDDAIRTPTTLTSRMERPTLV
jgi:hypothetical protein